MASHSYPGDACANSCGWRVCAPPLPKISCSLHSPSGSSSNWTRCWHGALLAHNISHMLGRNSMKAVILAGGLGTRLSEETDRIPKPMVTIGNWPILWHIMKVYSKYGITDFVICAGYKAHTIVEFFANYREHHSNVTIDLATNKVTCLSEAAEPWKITI